MSDVQDVHFDVPRPLLDWYDKLIEGRYRNRTHALNEAVKVHGKQIEEEKRQAKEAQG